eukprot:CAMPEP_0177702706 /NCGR_PEP_ID=MMETSP0484_2-20121128/7274_1 /TAXON_ID=354590 /ORGANISM="Rhodomonas lens, Strain RHODO" /LENGTH=299 /DNA_ID=CAMNT_0019213997 /DNA_START=83 /DNA_END=980 /DNA_ORIENTATION=+
MAAREGARRADALRAAHASLGEHVQQLCAALLDLLVQLRVVSHSSGDDLDSAAAAEAVAQRRVQRQRVQRHHSVLLDGLYGGVLFHGPQRGLDPQLLRNLVLVVGAPSQVSQRTQRLLLHAGVRAMQQQGSESCVDSPAARHPPFVVGADGEVAQRATGSQLHAHVLLVAPHRFDDLVHDEDSALLTLSSSVRARWNKIRHMSSWMSGSSGCVLADSSSTFTTPASTTALQSSVSFWRASLSSVSIIRWNTSRSWLGVSATSTLQQSSWKSASDRVSLMSWTIAFRSLASLAFCSLSTF